MDKMARYPATPSDSTPPTPVGGHGRRKIRCKMCRRHLAVREHMMDHILEQSPISRPRTPSNFALPSPRMSASQGPGQGDNIAPASDRERRPSVVSDIVNPLTGLPGRRSRHASMSSAAASPLSGSFPALTSTNSVSTEPLPLNPGGVPLPRKNPLQGLALTASTPEEQAASRGVSDVLTAKDRSSSPSAIRSEAPLARQGSTESFHSAPAGPTSARPLRTAADINSSLPPHLLALRNHGQSSSALSSPFNASPASSPEREISVQLQQQALPVTGNGANGHQRSRSQSSSSNSGTIGRRMSLLAMTPADKLQERRPSGAQDSSLATSGPPILVNPKCSGYFVEPVSRYDGRIVTWPLTVQLTWMEPFLKNGDVSGKIVCPNEKCGVKIGNFDWAGVQCGCKEWVTPVGFVGQDLGGVC
jgi:dual specificity phosphatase 12